MNYKKMTEEIREKSLKIIGLALEINSREKNTVILKFFGHTNEFEISIFYNGWTSEAKEDFFKGYYLDLLTTEEKKDLDRIIEKLEELKEA